MYYIVNFNTYIDANSIYIWGMLDIEGVFEIPNSKISNNLMAVIKAINKWGYFYGKEFQKRVYCEISEV